MDHSMTILIMDLHLVDQEAVEVGEVVAVVVSVMDLLEVEFDPKSKVISCEK